MGRTFAGLLCDELRRRGPGSGLQLQQRLLQREDLTGLQRLRLTFMIPHPELRALERAGLVTSSEEPGGAERDYRPRVLYATAAKEPAKPLPPQPEVDRELSRRAEDKSITWWMTFPGAYGRKRFRSIVTKHAEGWPPEDYERTRDFDDLPSAIAWTEAKLRALLGEGAEPAGEEPPP